MYIANPIYDVIFKYLMEDAKIAKLIISKIIDQEIEEISLRPQEFYSNLKESANNKNDASSEMPFFTVYRLDFSAKIKTAEGEKVVLIEIQKAKFAGDIMRFRKYLGEQYANKENVYYIDEQSEKQKRACEIISIYFLGHELDNIHGVPVIKSKKTYIDVKTGQEIRKKEYFIDSLTHESYTIVIPELKERRRSELETLLSVFDQANRTEDIHILNVKEEEFSERYREIIRRLQRAVSEPELRKKMDIEDEILEDFENKERKILKQAALIEEKDKALEEKDKVLEEKDKALEEKDKTMALLLLEIEELKKANKKN